MIRVKEGGSHKQSKSDSVGQEYFFRHTFALRIVSYRRRTGFSKTKTFTVSGGSVSSFFSQ